MVLKHINRSLGAILLAGLGIGLTILTKVALDEGGYSILLPMIMIPVALPFLINAAVSVLNRERFSRAIRGGIYATMLYTLIGAFLLPGVFEVFGWMVVAFFTLLAILVLGGHQHREFQLMVYNTVGALLLGMAVWFIIAKATYLF